MTQCRPAASPSLTTTLRASPSRTLMHTTCGYPLTSRLKRFAAPSSGKAIDTLSLSGSDASLCRSRCTALFSCTSTVSAK